MPGLVPHFLQIRHPACAWPVQRAALRVPIPRGTVSAASRAASVPSPAGRGRSASLCRCGHIYNDTYIIRKGTRFSAFGPPQCRRPEADILYRRRAAILAGSSRPARTSFVHAFIHKSSICSDKVMIAARKAGIPSAVGIRPDRVDFRLPLGSYDMLVLCLRALRSRCLAEPRKNPAVQAVSVPAAIRVPEHAYRGSPIFYL